MALGSVMVCGSAAPASAASQVDFSGYYQVMYMNETNIGYAADGQPGDFTDSYFQDRLQIDLNFHPTDEITVYWRFRGPSSYGRWGWNGTGGRDGMTTRFVYGEIKQDWGTVLVGRMSDDLDVAGLAGLGYQPSTLPVFTNAAPFDRADVMDGLRYTYDFDNGFSILGQYVKLGNSQEYEGGRQGPGNGQNDSDSDYDRFQLAGTYLWDGGGVQVHLLYDRNAQFNNTWSSRIGNYNAFYNDADRVKKSDLFLVNPAIAHSWGDFSVHFEGGAAWGKEDYKTLTALGNGFVNNNPLNNLRPATGSSDGDGYGAYLDFDYNYGPGNVTLAGWYVSGNDLGDTDTPALADLVAGNFYPLLVAYSSFNSNPGGNRAADNDNYGTHANGGAIGFANYGYENYVAPAYEAALGLTTANGATSTDNGFIGVADTSVGYNSAIVGDWLTLAPAGFDDRTRTTLFDNGNANHWGIALTGNHAFTDDISLHYGLGYLALVNPNYTVASRGNYDITRAVGDQYHVTGFTEQDKDLGFEIDLGISFQLLDNLELASGFGYMFNGDAYKTLKGYTIDGQGTGNHNIQAVWEDPEDSYVWFNSLTFSF
jgi:hypothetical protein